MTAGEYRFVWVDFGWWPHPDGFKRLLSWNAETKELAFWPIHRLEEPKVLAHFLDEEQVRGTLDGWAEYNATPEGLEWLTARLDGRQQ